jgi:AraC family transcriptional regulator
MATVARDRLRSLIDGVVESLDDPADGDELARRVHLSRFHHDRLVAAAIGESPGAFRRRLLLERAAHELSRGDGVLEVAVRAGYGSGEAFARAFRCAFGAAPSRFHGDFRLPAPNGIHFHPPGGLLVPGDDTRRTPMDLVDRMLEHDLWLERRLLDAAASLPEEKLDEPVRVEPPVRHAFPSEQPTVREMLERLIFSKETWTASLAGRDEPPRGGSSLDELRARLERYGAEFATAVRDIRDRGAWDTAFVDAVCDPPETFTFGGMVAHVLTWSAHRRHVAIGALRSLGAEFDGTGDPLEWERRAAA